MVDKITNEFSAMDNISGLTFRPLYPMLENKMYLVWKKHQVFSQIAERFLTRMKKELTATETS